MGGVLSSNPLAPPPSLGTPLLNGEACTAPCGAAAPRNTRKARLTAHQKVENTEPKHGERDADVSVVVEEIEHADAQTADRTHNTSITNRSYAHTAKTSGVFTGALAPFPSFPLWR